jgi:signal transduction histidine kinase
MAVIHPDVDIEGVGRLGGSFSGDEVERFVAAISHDLESSLRVMSGNLELLRAAGPPLSPEQDDHLERIERTTERMKRLLAGLRNYAWAGGEPEFERVCLQDVLDETLELLSHDIEQRSVELVIEGRLPQLSGDRGQLGQLFENLLSNAIKFGPERGQITITTTRRPHGWRIAISDEGPGIAPQHHRRVFEPFRRLRETGHVPGSGLGLAICMRVARNHHGALAIEATPGGGSTFALSLPDPPLRAT